MKPKNDGRVRFHVERKDLLAAPARTIVDMHPFNSEALCYFGRNFDYVEKDLLEFVHPEDAKDIAKSLRDAGKATRARYAEYYLDHDCEKTGKKAGDMTPLIWVQYADWHDIYHESLHAACSILERRGALDVKHIPSQETLAYMQNSVARQISSKLYVSRHSLEK